MNHKQEVSLRFSKTHLVHDIRILFKVFSDLFFSHTTHQLYVQFRQSHDVNYI